MKRINSYGDYILENMDLAKSIVNRKMEDFEKLKTLLSSNLGYIGKFTEYLFKEDIPYKELGKVYNNLIDLKKQNHQININNLKYEEVLDEVQSTTDKISINKVVSQFPSKQKKLLKELNKNYSSIKNILLKMSNKENLNVFISKVSKYHDSESLRKALQIFSKDPDNEKESVLSKLENLKSKVIYDKDDITIIYVDSRKDLIELASDTSWCIVNSASQWSSYVGKTNKQFIILNYKLSEYNPLFKVGMTLKPDGEISAAHDILDSGITYETREFLKQNDIISLDLISKVIHIGVDFKVGETVRHIKYGESKISEISDGNVQAIIKTKEGDTHLVDIKDIRKNIKLKSTTPITKWKEMIPSLGKEEIKEWASKLVTWRKTSSSKGTIMRMFISEYIKDITPYITKQDLYKECPSFQGYSLYTNKIIDNEKIDTYHLNNNINYQAFKDGVWSDEKISKINSSFFISDLVHHHTNRCLYTYNKLLDVYNKSFDYKGKDKGIQYHYKYELILIILSKFLKIEPVGKFKDNYDDMWKNDNILKELKQYMKIVGDIPIDLYNDNIYDISMVKNIIKKDYPDYKGSIYFPKGSVGKKSSEKTIGLQSAIMDHLEGYELNYYISKKGLFNYNINRYPEFSKYKIHQMVMELNNMKRKPIGTVITKGKHTLTLTD